MKHIAFISLFLLTLVTGFTSCDNYNKDAAPLFILVTPDDTVSIKNGESQPYHIVFYPRDNQKITSLTITAFSKNLDERRTVLDTTFTSQPKEYEFFFKSVMFEGMTEIRFDAKDEFGNTCIITRYVNVDNTTKLDSEKAFNLELSAVPNNNALNLTAPITVFTYTPGTSAEKIADLYLTEEAGGLKKLQSNSGIEFKISKTSYESANYSNISTEFEKAGTYLSDIKEFSEGDAIIFGRNGVAMGILIVKKIISGEQDSKTITLGIRTINKK